MGDVAHVAYVVRVLEACCKHLFEMFHLFQTHVASVLSEYCICFSGYTYMLQASIQNILSVLDVCCKCLSRILHMLQWLYVYVASVYCKYSTCFRCMLQKCFLLQHHTDTFAISKETRTLMHILHGNQLAEAKLSCTYIKLEIPLTYHCTLLFQAQYHVL
jgi:hypothetical protein